MHLSLSLSLFLTHLITLTHLLHISIPPYFSLLHVLASFI